MLFDVARREGRLTDLDLLCRRAGINSFKEKRLAGKLFLNTTPQELLEPGYKTGLTLDFLHEIGLRPERVVIELTEQYPMSDFRVMSKALEHYRAMGFEIAIGGFAADKLRQEVDTVEYFIGHVGRDDFIVIFSSSDWTERCNRILNTFSTQIHDYYTDEDHSRGGIFSISREGDNRFFPIMTLSIGVATPNINQFFSHHDIANMASQAKHNAKNIIGNSLFIDRRH